MKELNIKRIFIANRSEIACRIAYSAKKLGKETVSVYHSSHESKPLTLKYIDTMVDIDSPEVLKKINQIHLKSNQTISQDKLNETSFNSSNNKPASVFLNPVQLIQVAILMKCDAIHPGYGFLSENADFALKCIENGLNWIGPSPYSIQVMGSKQLSKQVIQSHNEKLIQNKSIAIPLIPGYNDDSQEDELLYKEMKNIGLPCLIKAAAGGGGRGMRIVREDQEFFDALQSARNEAKVAFGDTKLILEKYLENVKHVEIQIIGDQFGNIAHVNERDCSIQRRHQKIIEEAPSPILNSTLRKKITSVAVEIAKIIKYIGAGTVEFVVDNNNNFYFLEVNTRLQVEHPVTEFINQGEFQDLVALQIKIAQGYSISHLLDISEPVNHAIEVRICSENPFKDFLPCPGPVYKWQVLNSTSFNTLSSLRCDTGISSGSNIPMQYDPMIAKIIASGKNRKETIDILKTQLKNLVCFGVITNKEYILELLEDETFVSGKNVTTMYLSSIHQSLLHQLETKRKSSRENALYAALIYDIFKQKSKERHWSNVQFGWTNQHNHRTISRYFLDISNGSNKREQEIFALKSRIESNTQILCNNVQIDLLNDIKLNHENLNELSLRINGITNNFIIYELQLVEEYSDKSHIFILSLNTGLTYRFEKYSLLEFTNHTDNAKSKDHNEYKVSMPSQIVSIPLKSDANVKEGDILIILESMKIETKVVAWKDGIVKYFVSPGDRVQEGAVLLSLISNS